MVITEVCYLLARRGHGTPQLAAAFLESLTAGELDARSRQLTARTSRSSFPATATPLSSSRRSSADIHAPEPSAGTATRKAVGRSQSDRRMPCATQGWYQSYSQRLQASDQRLLVIGPTPGPHPSCTCRTARTPYAVRRPPHRRTLVDDADPIQPQRNCGSKARRGLLPDVVEPAKSYDHGVAR